MIGHGKSILVNFAPFSSFLIGHSTSILANFGPFSNFLISYNTSILANFGSFSSFVISHDTSILVIFVQKLLKIVDFWKDVAHNFALKLRSIFLWNTTYLAKCKHQLALKSNRASEDSIVVSRIRKVEEEKHAIYLNLDMDLLTSWKAHIYHFDFLSGYLNNEAVYDCIWEISHFESVTVWPILWV